jgi:hypothetical protein
MSSVYSVGDIFVLAGFHFMITAINSSEDIRCYLIGDYGHDLDPDRPIYFKNGEPVAYYPEGLFISKRDYYRQVDGSYLDVLCFGSLYLVPFKEYQFSESFLYEADDESDGVWVIGKLKSEIVEKLVKQIPVVLEKDKDIENSRGVKLVDDGEYLVDLANTHLDL